MNRRPFPLRSLAAVAAADSAAAAMSYRPHVSSILSDQFIFRLFD